MKEQDIVKFAEILEPGDEQYRGVVIEMRGDRALVQSLNYDGTYAPQSVYKISELEIC